MKEIIIIALLILFNGIFSMAEIALISARKTKLTNDAKQGSKAAETALKLANEPDRFLSTVQIGITLIGILTGIYSGATLADDFASMLVNCNIPAVYAHPLAQAVIVVIVTFLSIVLGELVPKRIGLNKADTVARIVATPMKWLSTIAYPFVWLLSQSTQIVAKLLGVTQSDNKVTEQEIISIIQEGTESGEVQEVEQDIIERVLVLGDLRVSSIMTARKDIVNMDINMTASEIRSLITENLHDAYPVTNDEIDEICGFVSLKDLILTIDKPHFNLASVVQPATFFPENMTVYTALEHFRANKSSRALVIDEFGGIQGIVTIRDILDGFVGSLEKPDGEPHIQQNDNGWIIDGMCPFYEFLAFFDCEDLYKPSDYATVSGLVLEELQHLPVVGEKLTWHIFSLEVANMDGTRIDKLLVNKVDAIQQQ